MIQVTRHPLSDPEKERLHQWAQMPAAIDFQRFCANRQAEAAADAGNVLMGADRQQTAEYRETVQREADEHISKSRVYADMIKLFQEMAQPKDDTFQVADLDPMPLTLPSTEP